jgi:hypothetical protein
VRTFVRLAVSLAISTVGGFFGHLALVPLSMRVEHWFSLRKRAKLRLQVIPGASSEVVDGVNPVIIPSVRTRKIKARPRVRRRTRLSLKSRGAFVKYFNCSWKHYQALAVNSSPRKKPLRPAVLPRPSIFSQ